MLEKLRQVLSLLIGFALLGGIVALLYIFVRASLRVITSLDSEISVAIIAAAATVFVSVISIILGKVYESRASLRQEHRNKKVPVYEDLLSFLFKVLLGRKIADAPSEEDTIRFIIDFNQRMAVWGSDEVLVAWAKWRKALVNGGGEPKDAQHIMYLYEELLFTIRRDLGHKNKNLKKGDILSLFVNDLPQSDKHAK